MENKLPLINIARLRMETDGDGVTTLIASAGCPLSCKYCINRPILDRKDNVRMVSPEELLEMVRIDDLYFQATGGGIVFGGGESLLHAASRNIPRVYRRRRGTGIPESAAAGGKRSYGKGKGACAADPRIQYARGLPKKRGTSAGDREI